MTCPTPTIGAPRVARELITPERWAWQQCHAATLLHLGDRTLVAFFAGTAEGAADNAIWLISRAGDEPWSAPRAILGAADTVAWWNPVLAQAPDGRVWLFARRGAEISQWSTFVAESADAGSSWSGPRELVPGDRGGRGPVKNPPVITASGAWIAPSSKESGGAAPAWDAFIDRSVDGGRSWEEIRIPLDHAELNGPGLIQPTVWETRTGVLVALMRSGDGAVYRSQSADECRTWTTAVPIALPNNNSAICAVPLPSGRVALVHNPVGEAWGARSPLSISVSDDDGFTWRRAVDLDAAEAAPASGRRLVPRDTGVVTDGVNEYSYPSAAVVGDEVQVVYTWQRRAIALAHVPLAILEAVE